MDSLTCLSFKPHWYFLLFLLYPWFQYGYWTEHDSLFYDSKWHIHLSCHIVDFLCLPFISLIVIWALKWAMPRFFISYSLLSTPIILLTLPSERFAHPWLCWPIQPNSLVSAVSTYSSNSWLYLWMQIGFPSLTGSAYEKQLEVLEYVHHDLSSLKRKSHAMASMVMQGPLQNWQQQIPQLDDEASQSMKAFVNLKFCALKMTAMIWAHVGGGMAISPGAITLLRMEQLNPDLCVDEGTLKSLEIKLKSLELLQHPDKVKLLQCGTQEGMESTSQPTIKIFLST